MTRRDWWLGVTLITGAIVVHASVPRYEWRHVASAAFVRIDRWTGDAVLGSTSTIDGQWTRRQTAAAAGDTDTTTASPRLIATSAPLDEPTPRPVAPILSPAAIRFITDLVLAIGVFGTLTVIYRRAWRPGPPR